MTEFAVVQAWGFCSSDDMSCNIDLNMDARSERMEYLLDFRCVMGEKRPPALTELRTDLVLRIHK